MRYEVKYVREWREMYAHIYICVCVYRYMLNLGCEHRDCFTRYAVHYTVMYHQRRYVIDRSRVSCLAQLDCSTNFLFFFPCTERKDQTFEK